MDLALAAVAGLAVIWVPGALLARVLRIGSVDALVRFAQESALGLSFWPVLFLFTPIWNATTARVVFALLAIALLLCSDGRPRPSSSSLALIAIVAFTRIVQIRGIALPLWVDSVHHTMIVRQLVEHGALPENYHWGFHAVTAFVAWISGMTAPAELPRLLLGFGQLLNVLVFVAVYCASKTLFGRRRTALLAATLATLVSLFPAYYVSWGRYTQLCGLLVLPPLARAFWRLGRHPSWRRGVEVALLGAGLVLIHVRVAIVFAVLAAILLVFFKRRGLIACATAGAVAMVIVAPWLVRIPRIAWPTTNAIPHDLLWAPHNPTLFALAAIALAARRSVRMLIPIAWILATPLVRIVPNSASVVMLFLPLSVMAAQLAPRRWPSALTFIVATAGASQMLHIVNPVTVLATPADVRALEWIGRATPREARFAVGVQPWIDSAFVGVDGGYWIPVITDRESILPPGLYPWTLPPARVAAITRQLTMWHDVEMRADLDALALLQREGVTHFYFGPRNEAPIRQTIAASPLVMRVYARDGVEIYAFRKRSAVR